MNKLSPKQKALLLIFIPTMLALGMVVSLILWVGEAQYTIWKVAITWGIIIIAIDVVLFLNTKIVARPKKYKPDKKKKDKCIIDTEEVIGDNPSDNVRINWDEPEAPRIERMGDSEKAESEKKDPLGDLAGTSGIVDTEPLMYEDADVQLAELEKPVKKLRKPAVAKPTPEPKEKSGKKKKEGNYQINAEHYQKSESIKETELEVVMPEQFDEAVKSDKIKKK
jgi:hypothetical protein